VLLFRSTCRNAFSLSRCGRGCLTCAADAQCAAVDVLIPAPPLEFASLMARHPRGPHDIDTRTSYGDVACA
jgi:hypothetical protein